jgi:hypothetical protein
MAARSTAALNRARLIAVVAAALAAALAPPLEAQKATTMTHAAGTVDVIVKPLAPDDHSDGGALGRMTIDKVYHGDLEGTAVGQMLTGMGAVKDSGVYVAVERVTATLQGRKGSFILHHVGVMDRGRQHLSIAVGPDSGTAELAGITGTLTIDIRDGKHYYRFDYSLPPRP